MPSKNPGKQTAHLDSPYARATSPENLRAYVRSRYPGIDLTTLPSDMPDSEKAFVVANNNTRHNLAREAFDKQTNGLHLPKGSVSKKKPPRNISFPDDPLTKTILYTPSPPSSPPRPSNPQSSFGKKKKKKNGKPKLSASKAYKLGKRRMRGRDGKLYRIFKKRKIGSRPTWILCKRKKNKLN